MTTRPPYLKPLLIVTTIIHAFSVTLGLFAAAVFSLGMAMMFTDAPGAGAGSMMSLVIVLLILLVTALPIGFTVTQWVLYRRRHDTAALVVSLIGIAPLILSLLSGLRG